MNYLKLFCAFFLLISLFSCEKEILDSDEKKDYFNYNYLSDNNLDKFYVAKVLSKAVHNKNVRAFLKDESLKKFDMDYDILIQLVKNKKIEGDLSFLDILIQYDDSGNIENIINKMPLLTVYIPQLHSFSPESWEIETEVPMVAVPYGKRKDLYVKYFESFQEKFNMKQDFRPSFPVIVLKDNERVVLMDDHKKDIYQAKNNKVFGNSNFRYYFIHDQENDFSNRWEPRSNTNPKIWDAFVKCRLNPGTYHKDYIYYSIFPPEGKVEGQGNWQYSEAITTIEFENTAGGQGVSSNWTEGVLELVFTFLFIGGDNLISDLTKVVYIDQTDLFDFKYEKICHPKSPVCFDQLVSVTPKIYHFKNPVYLVPFDLRLYGNRWKINVIERDPGITYNHSFSLTTTKSSNYKVDASGGFNDYIKVGAGFGGSTTNTVTKNTSVQYTTESDQLGEIIFDYFSPVIANTTGTWNQYYKQSTGTVVLTIETVLR